MTVLPYGCVCGHFTVLLPTWALSDEPVSFPAPFYVIEHPKGVAVFDCGLHRDMMDAGDRYRAALASQGMEVRLSPA